MSADPFAASTPLPRPTPLSEPFWEGCRLGELRAQRCVACGSWIFIPQPACTTCLSEALEWTPSCGRGRVYSLSVVHRPQQPGFTVPYIVAIVALEEGWTMLTNLVECAPEDAVIDLPVEVAFRRMSDEITMPCFRPAGTGPSPGDEQAPCE